MTAPLWLFASACIVAAVLVVLACCRMAAVQDEESETLREWLGMDEGERP